MTNELTSAINQVFEILKRECPRDCVSVTLFFNSQGYTIEVNNRSYESLKRDGVSMRDIRGDFIKDAT